MNWADVGKFISKNRNIDLNKFETSDEYIFLATNPILDIYKDLRGFQVTIDGDISTILIHGKDEMELHIIYSLRADMLNDKQIAKVIVTDELTKKQIKEYIKPNTRIKITAKYNGDFGSYDLVNIIDTDSKMKYGHYICPKCDYDYGRTVGEKYCCICDHEKLKYIDNFYDT